MAEHSIIVPVVDLWEEKELLPLALPNSSLQVGAWSSATFQFFLVKHPEKDFSTHHDLAQPADTLTSHRPREGENDNSNNNRTHLLKTHCTPMGVITTLPVC